MEFCSYRFGTLYMDGEPKSIPTDPTVRGDVSDYIMGTPVEIKDSVPGKKIHWIQPNGMSILIADRVLLKNISWLELDRLGFVGGTKVVVDGNRYFCRLVDANPKVSNEWTRAISQILDREMALHTESMFFWCRNKVQGKDEEHFVVYGYHSPATYNAFPGYYRQSFIGFRPVLVPIKDMEEDVTSTKPIMLDGQTFCVKFSVYKESAQSKIDFAPTLTPVMGVASDGTPQFSRAVFAGIPDGTSISMYSLLMDNVPVKIGDVAPLYKQGATLVLTDQFFGQEYLIPWKITDGKAVAAKPLLRGISKEEVCSQPFFQAEQYQLW